jgi:hypothetical protein
MIAQYTLSADLRTQGDLHRREFDARGRQIDLALHHSPFDFDPVDQHVVHRIADAVGVQTETHREIALRVHVDGQHSMTHLFESHAKTEGGRGLCHAALLISEGHDLGQAISLRQISLLQSVLIAFRRLCRKSSLSAPIGVPGTC